MNNIEKDRENKVLRMYGLLPSAQWLPVTTAVSSSLPKNQVFLLSALNRASADQHPPFPTFALCMHDQQDLTFIVMNKWA